MLSRVVGCSKDQPQKYIPRILEVSAWISAPSGPGTPRDLSPRPLGLWSCPSDMLEIDASSRDFFENFSSPPTLSANSQMASVDNSQSANSQIRDFKKLFLLEKRERRSRGTDKPSEEQCSSRLIESFSQNSQDFANSQCKFSNHLRICTFGGFENLQLPGRPFEWFRWFLIAGFWFSLRREDRRATGSGPDAPV